MPIPFPVPSSGNKEALARLRQTLAGKFPQAHPSPEGEAPGREVEANAFSITHPSLSHPLFVQRGEITEACGSLASGSLLLEAALRSVAERRSMMALVDGRSGFDLALPSPLLSRLLWVMAKDAAMAIKTADLLLRDGNLPLIVLDLQMNSTVELQRIPATTWYRFQRILEHGSTALLALTPRPMIASAAARIGLSGEWSLTAMHQRREALELKCHYQRRHQYGGENHDVLRIAAS